MRIASLFAGAVLATALAGTTVPVQAAPLLPQLEKAQSMAETVRHRRWHGGWNHCRAWRHECADRWGWGTWRYQRCVRRHGCGGGWR